MPKRMIRYRLLTEDETRIRLPRYATVRLFGCVAGAPHIWVEQGEESTRLRVFTIVQGDEPIPDEFEWVASTISDGISLHLFRK